MSIAFAVYSGTLATNLKTETEGSYEYTKGLIIQEKGLPGLVIRVYGKRQDELKRFAGQKITVCGELVCEKESKQTGAKNQYVIKVSDFGDNLNAAVVCGRLSKENELRYLDDGKAVLNNDFAVSKGKNSFTSWFKFSVFDRAAETLSNFTNKGNFAGVVGQIKVEKYQDKNDGSYCFSFKIQGNSVGLLTSKADSQSSGDDKSALVEWDGSRDNEVPF